MNEQPWTPTPGSDVRQAVTEAIGAASDDDEAALWVADGLVAWLTEAHGQNIEPESPPRPPEPKPVLGQAWRDAEGQTVVTAEPTATQPYITLVSDDHYVWCNWKQLTHPLTPLYPLYPIPDPDDDDAVEILRAYAALAHADATSVAPTARHVRAVLRALRALRGGA